MILDLPINEGAGRSLVDYSGHNHHCSFVNSPQWTGGRQGFALEFLNTDSDHCTSPRPSAFLNLDELSVLVWCRFVSASPATSIISHAQDPSQYSFTMGVASTTNRLRVIVSSNGTATISTAKLYDSSLVAFDARYRHVGFSWSGKRNVLELYVDGQLDPTPTKTWDFNVTRLHPSAARLVVGGLDGASFLTGEVASIKAWSRSLSKEEIQREYARTFIPSI